jgi:hypothetical protein
MKKSSLFTVLLLLSSLTVSYAQTGKSNQDTIKCYGVTELRHIASTIVAGRACDSALVNSKEIILNRESLIQEKEVVINSLNKQLSLKDQIILKKEDDIKAINLKLDKEIKKHKWTKYGWIATSVILGSLTVITAIN